MSKYNLLKIRIKRIIVSLLIIIIGISMIVPLQAYCEANNPSIEIIVKDVNNTTRTITADIIIDKNAKIGAATFSISYDINEVSFISSDINSNISNNNGTLVFNDNTIGTVKYSYVTTEPIEEEFVLTTMKFSTKKDYYGPVTIDIIDLDAVDYNGNNLNIDCQGSTFIFPVLNEEISVSNPFSDVKQGSYYYTPILWAYQNKVAAGITNTTFVPDGNCTRAQVVSFLWRTVGKPIVDLEINPFNDLKAGAYYEDAVKWAYKEGIVAGMTPTEFGPDEPVTRAQFVTFLWRMNGMSKTACSNPFIDLAEGKYYTDAVLWAYENNITAGVTPTTFAPDARCTRGQVVSFIHRAFTN